jgi:uncharacterized Zn finger protein
MQTRMQRDCWVCGGHEVERDEVLDASALGLAECTRCGHRWTERAPLALSRPLAWAGTEVAEAA